MILRAGRAKKEKRKWNLAEMMGPFPLPESPHGLPSCIIK